MNLKIGSIANTIFSAVVGGIITFGVTYLIGNEQNKIRYLDYSISNASIFNSDKALPLDKLKVIVNNNANAPIKEVSKITFSLYNLSDKDFDKLKLSLQPISSKNNDKSFQVIFSEIINDYRDNAKQLDTPSNNTLPRGFVYELEKLNRSEISKPDSSFSDYPSYLGILPVFRVTYVIAGDNLSNVTIRPKMLGLGVRIRDITDSNPQEYRLAAEGNWLIIILSKITWAIPTLFFIFICLIYFIIIRIAFVFLRRRMIVNRAKREKKFIDTAANQLLQSNSLHHLHTISDPAVIAQELVKINNQVRDKEDNDKFIKTLTDKLSQPNELANFQKLKETGVAEVLSKSHVETFQSNYTFLDFLKSSFSFRL